MHASNPSNPNQKQTGTGKSLIIRAMMNKVQTSLGHDSILVLAPTGIAALNIDGFTIHSKLHINTSKEFTDLNNLAARKFCTDMKNVRFIVIDEYSMVGCKMLGMIDRRLKQATGNYAENFGGLCVFFFGDIRQLPPVLDLPVYSNVTSHDLLKMHGKFVWDSITCSVILTEVFRQNDEHFKKVLKNISIGEATEEDYELLKTRFKTNVTVNEREKFKDAIKLFPLRIQVANENMTYLRRLRSSINNEPLPIAIIPAQNNCLEAEMEPVEKAGNLAATLFLAPTCKIILSSNLWTSQGLVSGSIGKVVDMIYEKDKSPPVDRPAVLICQFDNYKGPYLDDELKLVPIPIVTKSWNTEEGKLCARSQFPVSVACAITVHRAQGLTLLKAIIDIGSDKDKPPGLTFVALSRAKSIDGVVLEPFSLERFLKVNKSSILDSKKNFLQKLNIVYNQLEAAKTEFLPSIMQTVSIPFEA
ncbi:ATP-dependent DNA helicase pfh1 [Frankliniella fusca]|uniref:ATP-dependent DNA helicase n=1 Tax=Frankliniella fusca TaxID=407009 RepID=A0AAE1LFZ1_9NEOP|nr:ATP-dependent DNA helicase pfh1 [Frankliniella fusca]